MPRRRILIALATLVVVFLSVVVGAWFDFLPGGWTLRSWVEDPRHRATAEYARHRSERLALFARENATAPAGSIAFIGSSTIERFPLEACFPAGRALNRGIAGEALHELAARLEQSLPTAALAGIVLYAARIDFRADSSAPEHLARRVATLLERLHELRPAVPVCVLGLLSERDLAPERFAELQRFDAELELLVRARGATFVRTARVPLIDARGALEETFSSDPLHLASEGYTVLARWIVDEGGAVGRALAP